MQVSEKPKMLVSVFPSGRSVVTILKDGKTVWHTFPTSFEYEEILKEVSECETQIEVKERVWNEKMFQISESALISLGPVAALALPHRQLQSLEDKPWFARRWLSALKRIVTPND